MMRTQHQQPVRFAGLFNPTMLNSMAALDDQTSMFSVAARDAVGSSGRIGMEYKRDKHGGRERLLEELLTLVIWGFGVRAIKQFYDAGMTGPLKKLGINLPDLDTSILPKQGKEVKPGQQILTRKVLSEFTKEGTKPVPEQYKILSDVLKEGSKLPSKYQISSLAKFGVASLVPAAAIAFAVPTFNQWLTKNIISKETKSKQSGTNPQGAAHATMPSQAVQNSWGALPAGLPQAFNPAAFSDGSKAQFSSSPFMNGLPAMAGAANPFQPVQASPVADPRFAQHPSSPQTGQPRFGGGLSGVANLASVFLQNEQYNTLLIDGVISGGRTYKARNRVERAEILFREASLIVFLYAIQSRLQNVIHNFAGKQMGIPTALGFKDMQYIKDYLTPDKLKQLNKPAFTDRFVTDANKIEEQITEKLKVQSADLAKVGKTISYQELNKLPEHRSQAMLDVIHDYFLNQRKAGAEHLVTHNVVFESAINSGLIPTFKEQVGKPTAWEQIKSIGRELNPTIDKKLTDNPHLDLSKKINLSGVTELKDGMKEFVNKTVPNKVRTVNNEEVTKMLTNVMRLRTGSLVASNLLCFAALSFAFPEIQHWITYKMTGKNYFPGVQNGNNDSASNPKQQPQLVAAH